MNILPREETTASALGTGLSEGLQALANMKMQQIQQRNQAKAFEGLGVPPQVARNLGRLDPKLQQTVLNQFMQAPQQQAYAAALNSLLGGPQQQAVEATSSLSQGVTDAGGPSVAPGAPTMVAEGQPMGAQQAAQAAGLRPQQGPFGAGLTGQQATKLAELGLQKQKMSAQERNEAYKGIKEFRNKVVTQKKAATEERLKLKKFKSLNESGKLTNPIFYAGLKKIGLDIPALLSAESQDLLQTAQSYVKNVKDIFGNRILQSEIEAYMKTLPNLLQSAEGRKRIIQNMEVEADIKDAYYNAMKDILKGYEDRGLPPPRDLDIRVEERVSPIIDQLAEKFVQGMQPVAAPQQAGAGATFAKMPPAAEYSGKRIKDDKTGKVYRSDGKTWKVE